MLYASCLIKLQFKLFKVAGTINTVANGVNFQRDTGADYY